MKFSARVDRGIVTSVSAGCIHVELNLGDADFTVLGLFRESDLLSTWIRSSLEPGMSSVVSVRPVDLSDDDEA